MIETRSQNQEIVSAKRRSLLVVAPESETHLLLREQGFNPFFLSPGTLEMVYKAKKPDAVLVEREDSSFISYAREVVGRTPIISTTDDKSQVAALFDAGADYVDKVDYGPNSMGAHMRAILRRTDLEKKPDIVTIGTQKNITVDTVNQAVSVRGSEIHLSGRERQVLFTLIDRDMIVTQEELIASVWGKYVGELIVNAAIHRVNKKFHEFTEGEGVIGNIPAFGRYIIGYTDREREKKKPTKTANLSIHVPEYGPNGTLREETTVYISQDFGTVNLLELEYEELGIPFVAFTDSEKAQEYLAEHRPSVILKGDGVTIEDNTTNPVPTAVYSRDHSGRKVAEELDKGAYVYIEAPERPQLFQPLLKKIHLSPFSDQTVIGVTEIDWHKRVARVEGEEVLLTRREWEILQVLKTEKHPAGLVKIALQIGSTSDSVNQYVTRIRKKLGKDTIMRSRLGYTLGD